MPAVGSEESAIRRQPAACLTDFRAAASGVFIGICPVFRHPLCDFFLMAPVYFACPRWISGDLEDARRFSELVAVARHRPSCSDLMLLGKILGARKREGRWATDRLCRRGVLRGGLSARCGE